MPKPQWVLLALNGAGTIYAVVYYILNPKDITARDSAINSAKSAVQQLASQLDGDSQRRATSMGSPPVMKERT
jgi:hypothetical protein